MDTGPVHGLVEHPLPADASAGSMLTTLTRSGSSLLRVLLPAALLAGCTIASSEDRFEPTGEEIAIVSTVPQNGATGVDPRAQFDICFSSQVDPRAVEEFDARLVVFGDVSLFAVRFTLPKDKPEAKVVRELDATPVLIMPLVDRGGTCAAMAAEAGIAYRPLTVAAALILRYPLTSVMRAAGAEPTG